MIKKLKIAFHFFFLLALTASISNSSFANDSTDEYVNISEREIEEEEENVYSESNDLKITSHLSSNGGGGKKIVHFTSSASYSFTDLTSITVISNEKSLNFSFTARTAKFILYSALLVYS